MTDRLKLVPFDESHCTAHYINWLNDPEVVRYSEQRHQAHTHESCQDYYKSFMDSNCPNYFWAILLAKTSSNSPRNNHIGTLTAYLDLMNSVADIGILIGEKSLWSQGYGLEAWNAALDYLLGTLKLRKVTAGAISPNKASLSLMQKAGMKLDGIRCRQVVWEQIEVDVVHMAIFGDNESIR